MIPDNLADLVEKLRGRISSMERTIKDAEAASDRSTHTRRALDELRKSLEAARLQLAQAEQLMKRA